MLLSVFKPCAILLVAWATWVAADFELYKFYNEEALIAGLALSSTCLAALNATVHCNETTVNLLGGGADIHYWTTTDVTNLCTPDCVSSLSSWGSNVDLVCADETTVQAGVIVKARALPLTFTYNAGLTWQGSDYIRYDPIMCFSDGDDNSTVAPQCADLDFDLDVITDEMAALTNIYNKELFCNECFLELYRQRLLDPWLPISNFTDYLIKEFDSIQMNCSTTLSYSTSASTLYVGTATATTTSGGVTTTTDASSTATATCLGQVIQPLANWLTCNDLCDTGTPTRRTTSPPVNFLAGTPTFKGAALESLQVSVAPGGTFPKPNATITAPGATGSPTYYTAATPAHPTQSGSISQCGNYYLVVAGDDCSTIDQRFGLNFSQLKEYNIYLADDCLNLWLSYDGALLAIAARPTAFAGAARITASTKTARRRRTAPVAPIMGVRPVLPISGAAVVSTASVAMAPTTAALGIATRATVIQIMGARRLRASVSRISPEIRPARAPSLEYAARHLASAGARATIVLGLTAIAAPVHLDAIVL
ncbi:hypothetical protein BOTCAL_0021g00350 [Botryotinia calthae]|uniref:LysM domain-containing protein n=1 Tax=Botryotinia calthae TaxID=38488 RepID=A0A4Y8DH15_9HELO|nr:hypothetical protein BOTCAL_0021g00350 [Botryotinia calthae]